MEEPLLDVVAASEGSGAATAKAKRCSKLNPNVASVLALCAIGGFADSIWCVSRVYYLCVRTLC